MSEAVLRASVLPEFADLYNDKYRYIVYYSGRSTGKTYAVADSQITRSLTARMLFVDCREYQRSIRDSSKAQLESIIEQRGLSEYFTIERERIYNKLTGSEWAFVGLHGEPEKIKSYSEYSLLYYFIYGKNGKQRCIKQ